MLLSRTFLTLILLILSATIVYSQQSSGPRSIPSFLQQRIDPNKDLEQARQLEQLGQYDQAIMLYERVLRVSPTNAQALSALPRLYSRLQRYTKAIDLLERQVQRAPKNVVYRRMLADVLFKASREPEARQQCQAILEMYPKNESMIRLVASIYTDNRLYHDAVDTYQTGRRTTGKPNVFALTLAELYTSIADAPNAVIEYVRWVKIQPKQLGIVDDRIENLIGIGGTDPVQQALERAVTEKPLRVEVLKLLGNFYLRHGQPADALEQYRAAERIGNSKGAYLLEFASWCVREQFFDEAISAYMEIMTSSLLRPIQAQASLGLARTYHTTGRNDEAMGAYQHVITRYPKTRESAEAMFQIAELQLVYFHDPETALTAFRSLLAVAPNTARREDAVFRIADCHIARGSIQDAVVQYNQILIPDKSDSLSDETHERVNFRLAEMALFQGQFDEAVEQFNAVAGQFPGGSLANDALQWALLLGEARRAGDKALQKYIDAVLLERQYRIHDALDAYKQFLNTYPDTPISDLSVLGIGLILDDLSKPHEAIAAYRDLLESYPSSRHAVEAQRRIAEIYEHRLSDIPQAITEYETLLVNYPENFSNDAIRRKIRALTTQHPPRP